MRYLLLIFALVAVTTAMVSAPASPITQRVPMIRQRDSGLLIVTGTFDSLGHQLVKFEQPKIIHGHMLNGTHTLLNGKFFLAIQFADNTVTKVFFNARVSSDTPGPPRFGFFELHVPVKRAIKSITVVETATQFPLHKYSGKILKQ